MKTYDSPTKAGWYWWRDVGVGEDLWQCCRVVSSKGCMYVSFVDAERYPISEIGGEWIPIKEPHE